MTQWRSKRSTRAPTSCGSRSWPPADALAPSLARLRRMGPGPARVHGPARHAARVLAAQLGGYHHDTSDATTPALRDDEGLDPIGPIDDAIVPLHDAYA